MSAYPSKSDSAKLLEMAEKATPGKWLEGMQGNFRLYGPDNSIAAGPVVEALHRRDPAQRRSNLEFVAAARTSLPEYVIAYEQVMGLVSSQHGPIEGPLAHCPKCVEYQPCETAEIIRQWEGGV